MELPSFADRSREKAAHRGALEAALQSDRIDRVRLKDANEVFAIPADAVVVDYGSARRHV